MPSFLGRFLGISRRTERLIMNILGLVNSTLDWSPIKWSNKLEQIWNLSLSQGTRIFDIIGEDTIKTVLSWIVITRIVIAHLYTFSYMINLYPILTSTQPNLLLPWLILSFFKNVVLEVIVIAVGLLLWYDKRFSLTIFFEFVLVKVVPLIIFSYVWYSNSCLFLEQCHMEKIRKLKRMRSDSNLIVGRLYIKLDDSKYRTRSLTTLLSCESYETHDTHDTISRIIDDPNLTPAQKTMRILGLTDQDVADARTRIKEREIHKKLTELEDNSLTSTTKNMSRYFFDKYDFNALKDLRKVKDEGTKEREDEVTTDERKDYETPIDERKQDEIVMTALVEVQVAIYGYKEDETTVMEGKEDELTTSEATEDKVTTDIILSNPSTSSMNVLLEQPLDNRSICSEKTNPSVEQRSSSGMKRVAANCLERSCAKQMKLYPSDRAEDSNQSDSLSRKQDSSQPNLSFSRHTRQSVEKSSSPVKLQALFNCNCIVDEDLYKGNAEEYCFTNGGTMATSTPNKSIGEGKMTRSAEKSDVDSSKSTIYHSCLDDVNDVDQSQNQKTETTTNNSLLLIRELLQNDLNILRDIKKDDQKLENGSLMLDDKPKQDILKISESESSVFRKLYVGQCNTSIGIQNLSDIVKDLSVTRNVVTNLETLRTVESDESGSKLKNENEILRIMVPTTAIDDDVSSAQRSSLSPGKPKKTKKNVLKVNAPEYSFGDANIPRFVKDSMKVFDGCYEKDFANNSELQCMLQQLEKKKWSIFPGQPNQNMSIPSTFLKQNDQHYPSSASQDLGIVDLPITHFDTTKRYEISASTSSKETGEHVASEIVPENMQFLDDDISVLSDIHKPGISSFTKDAHTQSDNDDHQDQPRTSNLSEKHRKMFLKRKCLKEQSRSVSPIVNLHERKIGSQNVVGKDHGKPPMRQKPTKLNDNQRKPAGLTKSVSDRSICECKTCQKDNKYPISTESNLDKRGENKRCTTKCKVETFGTIPFSQVVRPSMFDSMVYRRKPPVYPKKAKNEPPAQPDTSSVLNAKKTFKELLEPSKRPADKQSSHGSKKFKWKRRMESLEEQEAREMKALKAYNEVTLVKDKKELEAKKKLLSGRNLATAPESLKNRGYPRKNNLERYKKNIPRNVETTYNDCFNKENLLTDATTETEPLPNLPFMDNKTQFAAPARFFDVPHEKYSCSKLSNANKVTDKVLNNFGKSHAEQVKQDAKKSKQTLGETDTRKQYTKYSKPKKSMDEENVSIVSMKKLEGVQIGRDLERTPAKEDVRSRLEISAESSNMDRLAKLDSRDSQSRTNIAGSFVQSDHDKVTSTFVDGKDFGAQVGDLATLIKPTATQDVASSWSSSIIEQEEESYFQKRDDANTQTAQLEATTLKLENAKEKDETVPKTENHEGEVEPALEAENVEKEVVPVSETEVQPKKVEAILEVTNHEEEVEPTLETEDQRNETESILKAEDQKQKFGSILVTKDHQKEVKLVSETEDYQKHTIEADKEEEIKESAASDDSLAEHLPESIDDEKEILQTDGIVDEITDEIRRYSSEVSQNEPGITSRRIFTNLSNYTRNIDTNYVADGVILSNSNAPRENNTPVWDIVDEETIRKLYNMFSHRSVDSTFNLPGEIQTVDDILNNRQSESSIDDFIFQSGRYSTSLSMYEHTILATIRPLQTLEEEEDHAGSLYDLCITTMDQEGLPISFEVESMEDLEDEVEHPTNRLGLNDVVIQVTRFLRNLNIRGFNLENLSGVLEILPDPVDDDEDRIEFEIDEEDEEKDEEMEEWPIEDRRILKFIKEDCLRFIKEDIFTDMKFPIVVRLSDVIGDDLATSDEEPEELDVVLEQAEPSKINLFSLMDDKYEEGDDKIEETGTEEMEEEDEGEETTRSEYFKMLQKIRGTMFTTAFPSRPIVSVSDYNAAESMLNEERITTCSEDASLDEIVVKFMSNLKKYILKRSEQVQFRRQNLNQTYEILDKTDTEEEIKFEESIGSEEIEGSDKDEAVEQITTVEDVEEVDEKIMTKQNKVDVTYQITEEDILDTRVEEYGNVSWKEIDKADQNIQLIEFESEANEKMQISVPEETFERDEDESLEKLKSNKIDGNEETDFEVDGEGSVELKEKLSLYTIFTFLLAVSCFYLGYYYQKIFSFKQISTSTSTLKPFEIHATPTSTTPFFENSTLMKETKEEKYEETEQEENDSFERIVDLETIEISQFTKYDSELDLDSIVHRTLSDSLRTIDQDSLKEIENEVGESVSLRGRILENTELQEEAAEINSENVRVRSNSQIHSASRSTDTIGSASIRKLDIRTSEPPFIVEPNKLEEDSLELRLAEEEIETFKYREDDDSDSSKSLPTRDDEIKLLNEAQVNLYAKVVIEEKEEMLNAEELRTSSCGAKAKTSTSKIQKEDYEQSSKEEEEKEERSVVDQTDAEGIIFSKQEVEKSKASTEQNESSSSPQILETTDSFDSTYTRASETSRNATSAVDLNDSSMEEFVIASNESITSDKTSGCS
ncbi:uncharacterized protein LOC122569221 [Bombus pyrosoma]|uniref:uncharacterized protein LOC122569221 n=1 Tax=Bombus pyrosoma TaxID=396416 RepID=UPI001CB9D60C|nr:uncharacterized protein LOC122569221 [Bombus pyrosoma]